MAYIVREGGFLVILLARLSAIPGHFTTAVFATVGMNFFIFTLATLLSMPKQLLVVYLGVVIEQSGSGTEPLRSKIIKYAVLVISGLVTVGVAVFLYGKMQQARPHVQRKLQQRRFVMLTEAGGAPTASSSEEGMLGGGEEGDEASAKLYGRGGSDLYSTDDLENAQINGKKGKGASRWKKWGRKDKNEVGRSQMGVADSMESFEKGANGSIGRFVMEDGVRMSFEADSLAHSNAGDETLKGNNPQYVKARPEQAFASQQQQQQDYNRFMYPQSAPPSNQAMPNPYDARGPPISAPIVNGGVNAHNGQYAGQGYYYPSSEQQRGDPRRNSQAPPYSRAL